MSEKVFLFQGVRIPVEAIPGKRFRILYAIFDRLHKRLYEMVAKAAQEDPVLKHVLSYAKAQVEPAESSPVAKQKPQGRRSRKVTLLSDIERDREKTTEAVSRAVARSRRGRTRRYAGGEVVVEATPADVMYIRSNRGD